MTALTTTYSVPDSIAELVMQKPDLISDLFYPEYRQDDSIEPEDLELPNNWEPKQYGFDKSWDDFLLLYDQIGEKELRVELEKEVVEVDHDGRAWIRYWLPDQLTRIRDLMSRFDSGKFFDSCMEVENLRDGEGHPIEEYHLEILTNMHESFALFIEESVQANDYMFAITE